MPQKLSHEADPKNVPDVVYVSPMEMKPNRVMIGLIVGAIVLIIGIGAAFVITNFVLTDATPAPVPSVEIKKASPSTKIATPSSQKDKTEGWKTYTNSKLGFSLKHPSNYNIKDSQDKSINIVSISTENFKLEVSQASKLEWPESEIEEGQDIWVIVEEFSGPKTLEDLVEEERKTNPNLSTTSTILGGLKAAKINYGYEEDLTFGIISDSVLSINNNKAYAVLAFTARKDSDLVNTYETILSTFRFD